jgi:hypothetical protein
MAQSLLHALGASSLPIELKAASPQPRVTDRVATSIDAQGDFRSRTVAHRSLSAMRHGQK